VVESWTDLTFTLRQPELALQRLRKETLKAASFFGSLAADTLRSGERE
jgi:hypothetical protein